jgi:hypothetical protein
LCGSSSGSNPYMIGLCPIKMSLKPYGHILWNDLKKIKLNVTQLQHHALNHVMTQSHEGYAVQRGA